MTRILLFLSSLAPGIVVVSIRYLGENLWVGITGIALGLILLGIGMWAVRSRDKTRPIPTEVVTLKDETYQIPTYLVTFILPFLFIEVESVPTLAAYAVFILLVVAILYKSDVSIVSPALLLRGYRLYDVVDKEKRNITVVSRTPPKLSGYEKLRHLSGTVYLLEPHEGEA